MIEVRDLSFSYGKIPFIEHMRFSVADGEIFGFLGPSGAGKSTLQKLLTGLLPGYRGSAKVNGVECKARNAAFYEGIGVDFEFSTLYEKLTARENLRFFASLYSRPCRDADGLLAAVDLLRDADKRVSDYSKGMKARLNFIRALLHDPAVLFLDEPTSGLDPANARVMKDLILEEKRRGKTVVLTTHNMADAAELCGRVAFIVGGALRALDSPHALIMSRGAAQVTYAYGDCGEHTGTCALGEVSRDKTLSALIAENRLRAIHSSEPTLSDIFLEVTGRALE